MKRFIAVLLAALMVFSLCGCGLLEKLPTDGLELPFGGNRVEGKYSCVAIVYRGESNWHEPEEEIWIQLEKNGEAVFFFEGHEYTLLWELSGESSGDIKLNMGRDTLISGTLSAGVMQVTYGEDCIMVLTAKGVDAPGTDSTVAWSETSTVTEPPVVTEAPQTTRSSTTTEALASAETEPIATEPVVTEPTFEPIVFTVGDHSVSLVGAEHITTQDGYDAIRIYYDFTNSTDHTRSIAESFTVEAYQHGDLCMFGYTEYDPEFSPKYEVSDLYIRPGCTVRSVAQFEVDMGGEAVSVVFCDYVSSDTYTVSIEPGNLPGAPEGELPTRPVDHPAWTEGLSDGGVYNGEYYCYIDRATFAYDYDGQEMLKVIFEFTNNSAEETSFWAMSYLFAYQDGVQLRVGIPEEMTAEDEAYYSMVSPGETVSVAVNFILRSQSPVEIELVDFMDADGENLGCVFTLAD